MGFMKIKQLAKTTNIRDCSRSLWRWLEMNERDVRCGGVTYKNGKMVGDWKGFPLIGQLPFEVWQATEGKKKAYGMTREAAVSNLIS
jgi:hypothetical protein